MRVLVCGSRTFDKLWVVCNHLDGCVTGMGDDPDLVVIHGGARGADSLAGEWARMWKLECEVYPAKWELYGNSAGPIRNREMLDMGKPDLVLAFVDRPLAVSRGTAHMVNLAREYGIETWVTEVRG